MRGRNQINPTLDRYLKDSFEVIRYVHDNLPVLQRIAGRLTPVEDLVEFKNQVEHLYGHLAVLTEASQIILRISDAGFNLMTAPSVPAQRALLGLGSAALKNVEFFATAAEFSQLRNEFDDLVIYVDEVVASLDRFATKDELEEVKGNLQELIDDFADTVQLGDLINNELEVIIDGETFTGLASALTDLYSKITEVEDGLIVEAGKITLLESRIVDQDGSIEGLTTAQEALTTSVSLIDDRLTATSQDVTDLSASVSNLDHDIYGSGGALDLLRTTVTQQGEDISVESERLTRLSAEVTGLDGSVSAHADALSSLTSTVNKNENDIEVISLDTVQLQSRMDLVDDELAAEATAREDLETRVEQNETGLLIQGENITEVRAALTAPGNLLPNSNFESEPLGWFVRQRGSGWITVDVSQNLDAETKLPEEVNALSVSVSGVPSGELGISSPRTPVEPNKSYILSGYLAAENCTVSLEWRALNAAGSVVEYGVAGEVTNEGGGKSLADWPRVHGRINASHDVVLIEAQLWVRDANTASPKAWLVRPMLEEASLLQEDPSPWVPGASGLDQKYAQATEILRASLEDVEGDITGIAERLTALEVEVGDGSSQVIQDLIAQVTENKDGITANANSVTKLSSRLGAVTEWEIFIDEDASQNSYLRLASEDEISLVFQRGITLVRFTTSGELSASQHFDTFAGAGQRNALISALNSLGDEDYFVLVGQPNLGNKPGDLVEAFLRVGAQRFGAVVPSRAYVLLGRGGIGPGGGIEHFSRNNEDSLRVFFTLIRDAPKEIGGFSATADALSEMSTSVQENKDGITAVSESVNLLGAETPDGQGFILDQNTVHVTPEESLAQWRSSLQASFDDANARIDAEETARADGDSALATTLATVQATANNAATKAELTAEQTARADADAALSSRVDLTEARLGSIEGAVNPSFERDGGWGVAADNVAFLTYANARSGARVLAFRPSTVADRNQINEGRLDVAEGQTVRAGAWVRWIGNARPIASAVVSVIVRGYDKDGGLVSGSVITLDSVSGDELTTSYALLEGAIPVPGNWFYAALQIRVQNHTGPEGSSIAVDDAFLQVDSRGVSAVATALVQTQAEVSDHEGRITANTSQINVNTAAIGDKADSSTVTAIQNTVTQQGNTLTAHGTQLSGLSATVGNHTASINEQREVLAAASVTGVVLNASFEDGPAEQAQAEGWGSLPANTYVFAYPNARTGARVLRFDASTTTDRSAINNGRTPVTTGQQVRAGYWARFGGAGALNAGSTVSLIVRGYDVGGSYVSGSANTVASVPGNSLTSNYQRISGTYTVPANVRTVTVQVRVQNQSAGSLMVDDVFLEPVGESLADVMARYSLAVTAGGDVAGIELLAGGGTSAIRFLADMFSVVDPGGGSRLEWSNGAIRVYDGSQMRVRLGRLS